MPAGAIAGAGLASAGANFIGSSKAADAQTKSAQIAAQVQREQYNQTRSDLAPYRDLGNYAGGLLQNRLTELTSPIVMDQSTLEQTPGYQFTLNQGLKAAQSSAAARGLGLSGAAIKAASKYTTVLADNTYLDQFNVANTNRTNAFNRLYQAAGLGQSAAAGTGTAGISAANGASNALIGAGNARGGAAIAGSNAFGTGANALAQYFAQMGKPLNSYLGNTNSPNLSVGTDDDWF